MSRGGTWICTGKLWTKVTEMGASESGEMAANGVFLAVIDRWEVGNAMKKGVKPPNPKDLISI